MLLSALVQMTQLQSGHASSIHACLHASSIQACMRVRVRESAPLLLHRALTHAHMHARKQETMRRWTSGRWIRYYDSVKTRGGAAVRTNAHASA
jgi:hypothetical protein